MVYELLIFNKILNVSLLSVSVALVCQLHLYQASDIECGTVDFTRPIIEGGSPTIRGDWPFIATLRNVEQSEYFCGGTLISTKHVLTAAHCIQEKYSELEIIPEKLVVRLGAYNLTDISEFNGLHRNVSEIYVHPEWDVYEDNYDADIAILVLRDFVTYTSYIRPICMPEDDPVIDVSDIGVGYIVVWGSEKNKANEEIPRLIVTSALNNSYCYSTDVGIVMYSSARSFCGWSVEPPSKSDSGGGFFLNLNFTWVQHGIISAIPTNVTGIVNAKSVSVNTKVADFKDWIDGIIKLIVLDCQYRFFNNWDTYGCWVQDLDVQYQGVASFSGTHEPVKTDQDVTAVVFHSGTVFYLPNGIGKHFTNLKYLYVKFLRVKLLRRSNFENMEKLVDLQIYVNGTELFDQELLWDLPNLEKFKIFVTVKSLQSRIFAKNTILREVEMSACKLESIHRNLFRNNLLLEKIDFSINSIKTIDEKIFEKNTQLMAVDLSSNQLQFLPRDLFRNNLLLEEVDLTNNQLDIIEIDFTRFKNIRKIYFYKNTCIDTDYQEVIVPNKYRKEITNNLTQLQNSVRLYCTDLIF